MNNQITKTQCKSYRDDGYIIIDDFLDDTELNIWQEAVEEAVAARENKRLPYETAQIPVKAQNEIVFQQRINLWMDHPGVRRLMFDDRIGKMAADLEGVEGIRIWHDQVLTKQPWANPTTWHQDNTKWSFSSAQAITIWVALDEVDARNGCMFFLPGTHRRRLETDFPTGAPMNAIFAAYPDLTAIDPVAAELPAGGCSFHNGLTVHAAAANMSRHPRRAMTCAFMPDGATFNGTQNVLPDRLIERLQPGDVLNDDEQNPIIWREAEK